MTRDELDGLVVGDIGPLYAASIPNGQGVPPSWAAAHFRFNGDFG